MNTTTTRAPGSERAPGLSSALRGELRLARLRPAVKVSLGLWAASIIVFAYLIAYLTTVASPWYSAQEQELILAGLLPAGAAQYVLTSLPLYGTTQLAILGAVLGTGDITRGTLASVATRFPSRTALIAGRFAAMWVIAALAAVVTLTAGVLASLGVAASEHASMALSPVGDLGFALVKIWLVAGVFIGLGFAVGTLTRSTLAAVAICAGWILGIEALAVGVLAGTVPVLADLQGYLPAGAVPVFVTSHSPVTGGLVLIAWTIVSAAVTFMVFRRRDLT